MMSFGWQQNWTAYFSDASLISEEERLTSLEGKILFENENVVHLMVEIACG